LELLAELKLLACPPRADDNQSGGGLMGPIERRLRKAINPLSTGLTTRWLGPARRQLPAVPKPARAPEGRSGAWSPGAALEAGTTT
jgi:hypothetical protein